MPLFKSRAGLAGQIFGIFVVLASLQPLLGATASATTAPIFVTLGTGGGPMIRTRRAQPANALVVDDAVYLFDVGEGVLEQMTRAGLALDKVRAVFISHHHIDHDAGLGALLSSRWLFASPGLAPLPVIGPLGTVMQVRGIGLSTRPASYAPIQVGGPSRPPLLSTVTSKDLPRTMEAPQLIYSDGTIRVLAITNDHFHFPPGTKARRFSRSYAFRIETKGKSIVFTGDTGPSLHLGLLARGADLLVSEVVDLERVTQAMRVSSLVAADRLPSLIAHMKQDHLTPIEVAKLAADAGVGSLVLTHFVPGADDEIDLSAYTRGISAIYHGRVSLARDLDRFVP